MVTSRYYRTRNDGIELMETYSTENKNLRQIETDTVYGTSVIDVIEGYNDGVPYGAHTYEETNEGDPSVDAEYIEAAKIMLGEVD